MGAGAKMWCGEVGDVKCGICSSKVGVRLKLEMWWGGWGEVMVHEACLRGKKHAVPLCIIG